jgi:uncharacterized membrane protein YdcZ (DUF606 family)
MSWKQLLGIALIVIGVLGLLYENFSYTKETHEAKFGPFQFSVAEKENVNVPRWLSVGAIAAGSIVLIWRKKS